jgi:hypothetical protein
MLINDQGVRIVKQNYTCRVLCTKDNAKIRGRGM